MSDPRDFFQQLDHCPGPLVIEEAALHRQLVDQLIGWLEHQPDWLDLPIVVLCETGHIGEELHQLARCANLHLVTPPLQPGMLQLIIRAAVRERERQLQAHTHLLRLERQLQAQNARARLAEETPFPIVRVDGSGRVLYANPAAHALLRLWQCGAGEAVPEHVRQLVGRALTEGMPFDLEERVDGHRYLIAGHPVIERGYANLHAQLCALE